MAARYASNTRQRHDCESRGEGKGGLQTSVHSSVDVRSHYFSINNNCRFLVLAKRGLCFDFVDSLIDVSSVGLKVTATRLYRFLMIFGINVAYLVGLQGEGTYVRVLLFLSRFKMSAVYVISLRSNTLIESQEMWI